MIAGSLSDGEFEYEWTIRQDLFTGDRDKQRSLRHRLMDEGKNPHLIPTAPHGKPEEEMKTIEKKIQELKQLMVTNGKTPAERNVLRTKIVHLNQRLNRIRSEDQIMINAMEDARNELDCIQEKFYGATKKKTGTTSEDGACFFEDGAEREQDASSVSSMTRNVFISPYGTSRRTGSNDEDDDPLAGIRQQLDRLEKENQKLKRNTTNPMDELQEQIRALQMENERIRRQSIHPHNNTSHGGSGGDYQGNQVRSQPVNRWGLTFSGDGKTHVLDFLSRVKLLARSEQTSDGELLRSAYYFFTGEARNWYVTSYEDFTTWEELERELKANFLPHEHDMSLKREIEARKQRMHETSVSYFSDMELRFKRLSYRMSESEKLSLLRHNLHPFYKEKLIILEISTIKELKRYCHKIQALQETGRGGQSNQFSEGNRGQRNYRAHNIELEDEVITETSEEVLSMTRRVRSREVACQTDDVIPPPTTLSSHMLCHNCKKPGHHYRSCPEQRNLFCFRCGTPGVVTTNCPKCHSGNF
jgi:Retrotransposon gag protein